MFSSPKEIFLTCLGIFKMTTSSFSCPRGKVLSLEFHQMPCSLRNPGRKSLETVVLVFSSRFQESKCIIS
jgi:hypothetical protein